MNPDDLDDTLARYVDRMNAGERILPEEILADHPDQGQEILDLLADFVSIDSPPPLGTLGDYTLRRQIGRGGMGVVYEAWQNSVDRRVALKVLPAGIAADNKAFMRFMREARAAAQLNHRNVVAVYAMGQEEKAPYFAMEYIEGETLAQLIPRLKHAEPESDTPFGTKECAGYFEAVAQVFADVTDGLQHAHAKGVVHRDIKPSNLILDQAGRLRILDFGLAQLEGQESLTRSGDVVGTPLYMSPEQARQRTIRVDHRTDIYSLGATLYEMLTSRPPFKGKDHHDTLSQIMQRDPVDPRRINPRVPRELETIVLKCLRKDPDDRYGTAEALAQDLKRFARGDPVEARPQARWEKTARRLWRHRTLALASLGVLLLTLAGLAVSNVLIARARDAARYDLYVSNMRLAMTDWESGNFQRFTENLDRHVPAPGEPDLRG